MKWIDLRSDTVTQPTPEMREAMAGAVVGDDIYEDDPTLKELEDLAAHLLQKEAALFVPSGIFGNQLCLFTHTRQGDEVIVADHCHIVDHEVGAAAVIASVQLRFYQDRNGTAPLEQVKSLIRGEDLHYPRTALLCMENAHSSGAVVELENMRSMYQLAQEHGIPLHLDGARIFNAAVHLGVDAGEIARYADSVMFCLSKGLCAPVGSMVVGSREFIARARKNRRLMGGALRQGGILGAAGIVALRSMRLRLEEDHRNAGYLAEKLQQFSGVEVLTDRLAINMVFCKLPLVRGETRKLVEFLLEKGIKVNPPEGGTWRFVTHNDVGREQIDAFLHFFQMFWKSRG
ncbi:MAG TPA: low-specificity L-threonine aldolase [Thermotogota bacterium]|nr:low-specificity L-threonine aldolase [Thermotogota bacterium]